MSKQKKQFKKLEINEKDFIEESGDKKSILLLSGGVVIVIGLIFGSVFLLGNKELKEPKANEEGEKVDIKLPIKVNESVEENETIASLVASNKFTVIYLDKSGAQIGKTQRLLNLEDRINEKAPKVEGFRFEGWEQTYDSKTGIYYYEAKYLPVVERISVEEEPYLEESDGKTEETYVATVTQVLMPGDKVEDLKGRETEITNPTYEVEITGEVEKLLEDDISDELTIDEKYNHIISLRFNAPEDITKEQIEKMKISVFSDDPTKPLNEDQYHYNGEDLTKSGRDLLDSTDEEYAAGEYYFYYYQEADTKTNTNVEVYWGNDPDENLKATPTPIPPKDEYVEEYNINLEKVTLEP